MRSAVVYNFRMHACMREGRKYQKKCTVRAELCDHFQSDYMILMYGPIVIMYIKYL